VYQEGGMAHIKLEIEINKGKRGVSLLKLEHIVKEMRQFLVSMADDIELVEPHNWVSLDFTNGSLGFVTEYSNSVAPEKLNTFNDAIVTLCQSEYPSAIRRSTANGFFEFSDVLEQGELAKLVVFDEKNTPVSLEISQDTGYRARLITVLPYRRSQGAVQGKIHSLYKESKPDPFFYLRELSSGNLVKCVYKSDEYSEIYKALASAEQVMHVRGTVVYDTHEENIHHIDVQKIQLADSYDYEDVKRFLHPEGA
jgi:hypothetical protein